MSVINSVSFQPTTGAALTSQLRRFALATAVAVSALASPVWAQSAEVNINTAAAEVLAEHLSGVGMAKAYRIVEYREAHGPFESIDELSEVSGIGDATVERNRERILID